MRFSTVRLAAIFLTVSTAAFAAASPVMDGKWSASSETASAITGNIVIDRTSITMNGKIKLDLQLVTSAAKAAGSTATSDMAMHDVRIYKVTSSANPTLKSGNTLCGSSPVKYIVAGFDADPLDGPDKDLTLALYDKDTQPDPAKLASPCATYSYSRS